MMRIGYVLKKFPRLSETFILNEVLGLEAIGHEIEIFSLRAADDEPRHADFLARSPLVTTLPTRDSQPIPEEAVAILDQLPAEPEKIRRRVQSQGMALKVLCRERGVDHIHAHFMTGAAQVAALASSAGGPSFSVTCHAKDIFRHDVNTELFRLLHDRASRVITVSDFNRRYISERFLQGDASKIERIYNGLPLARLGTLNRGARRQPKQILAVGRLVEKKGFQLLLTVMGELLKTQPDARLIIVGDGDERAALESSVSALKISKNVEFMGSQPRETVLNLMQESTLLALPCRRGQDGNQDALPTVLIEALSLGLPVVSTRLAGIPEIVDDGVHGLLVEPEDPSAFHAALSRILSDPNLSKSMSGAGPKRAQERFDSRETLRELAAVFAASLRPDRGRGVGAE